MTKPNILLILTDQQRYGSLGCYGADFIKTPNLDKLAEAGILFENCYVNNPICTPSRASMWTGKHVPGHKVYQVHGRMPDDQIFFTEYLQQQGYDTALLGKLHVSGHAVELEGRHPHDGFRLYEWAPDPCGYKGFDNSYWQWLEENQPEYLAELKEKRRSIGPTPEGAHYTYWTAERTINFIENDRDKDKPFFCCMSMFDPHDPYINYPPEFRKYVNEEKIPARIEDENFSNRPGAHSAESSYNHFDNFNNLSEEDIKEIRVGYYAAVAFIDSQVGRVLETLEKHNLKDNTIVIFTSDHGDMLGDHGLMVKGSFSYDQCTRVPMLVRWPERVEKGKTEKAICQPHDIAATILKGAGFTDRDVKDKMPDSVSLLDSQGLAERGYAVSVYRNTGVMKKPGLKAGIYHDPAIHSTMWREGDYKFNIYHEQPDAETTPGGELFNLKEDPQELNNLWDSENHRELKEKFTNKVTAWLKEQGDVL